MKLFASTSLLAIALAALPAYAQDAPAPAATPGGFRLPPSSTPTPTDVQGPVDPDAPILTRPKAPTPTPTPRPTAVPAPTPTPRPAEAPTERVVPPPRNSTLPPRFTPAAAPTAQESAAAAASSAQVFPTTPPATATTDVPAASASVPSTGPVAAQQASGTPGWLFALAGLLLAAIAGALALWWRKRQASDIEVAAIEAPRIVPPSPVSSDTPAPAAAPAPPPVVSGGAALVIEARAVKLARSMIYATLSYELLVTNRSGTPLENVRFGGDLVTAHARVPADQQLADPAVPLAPMQEIARLDPGESAELAGELRLPVGEIRPIPHGKAVVYVPLLRVRAEAAGMDPVARTFVVGMLPGMGGKLQPFRLDEMPQTYVAVGQRALD